MLSEVEIANMPAWQAQEYMQLYERRSKLITMEFWVGVNQLDGILNKLEESVRNNITGKGKTWICC